MTIIDFHAPFEGSQLVCSAYGWQVEICHCVGHSVCRSPFSPCKQLALVVQFL